MTLTLTLHPMTLLLLVWLAMHWPHGCPTETQPGKDRLGPTDRPGG